MKRNVTIDRRRFLGITTGMSVCACLPSFFRKGALVFQDKESRYIQAIINTFDELEEWEYDTSAEQEEIDYLSYAFKQIRPRNHQELTFIIACRDFDSRKQIIDEYVRRRNGDASFAPDPPILAELLQKINLPDTQRILIYFEQIWLVLFFLIDPTSLIEARDQDLYLYLRYGGGIKFLPESAYRPFRWSKDIYVRELLFDRLYDAIIDKNITVDDFHRIFCDHYRSSLGYDEAKSILEAIKFAGPPQPYSEYSTIADKVSMLVAK